MFENQTKMFMNIFLDVQKSLVVNISSVSVEELIWQFTALRNILFDLALVNDDDLNKPVTYFQKLAVIGS